MQTKPEKAQAAAGAAPDTAARLAALAARRVAQGATADPPEGLPRRSRRTNLTDRKLADLAAQQLTRRIEVADTTLAGLTARIAPGGRITFTFRWRVDGGGFRRANLDAQDVAEARDKALQAKTASGIGRDPRATSAAHAKATAKTVAEVVPDYLAALEARGRAPGYRRNVDRIFSVHVLPHIGRKRLMDLTRLDLADMFRRVAATKSSKAKGKGGTLTAMVNRVHSQMTGLLSWAVQEGRIPPGVAPVMPKPLQQEPSARALKSQTKPELRPEHLARLWLLAEPEPAYVRALLRLLILLPMRREEITRLSWPEVRGVLDTDNVVSRDTDTFAGPRLDIPAERMKGGRPQVMPLPPLAVGILRDLHKLRGADGAFVFSHSAGRKSYAGWRTLATRLRVGATDLPDGWVVHDIRGGIATAMGEAGEDEATIARLLHHSELARRGVTARYDRSRRLKPMLETLERWEATIARAVEVEQRRQSGGAAMVLPLARNRD